MGLVPDLAPTVGRYVPYRGSLIDPENSDAEMGPPTPHPNCPHQRFPVPRLQSPVGLAVQQDRFKPLRGDSPASRGRFRSQELLTLGRDDQPPGSRSRRRPTPLHGARSAYTAVDCHIGRLANAAGLVRPMENTGLDSCFGRNGSCGDRHPLCRREKRGRG